MISARRRPGIRSVGGGQRENSVGGGKEKGFWVKGHMPGEKEDGITVSCERKRFRRKKNRGVEKLEEEPNWRKNTTAINKREEEFGKVETRTVGKQKGKQGRQKHVLSERGKKS